MTDEQLIEQIKGGSKTAVRKFCDQYRLRLEQFVSKKVSDRNDVEEIVQDVFISVLDSLPMYQGRCSLFTWICSIAKHEVADFYRRKKIKQVVFSKLPFLEKLVSKALGPELAFQEKETKRKIWQTLKKLSEGYSQILRLKYIDDLSMKQIAVKIGISVKAVESRLSRARLAFQKAYEQDYRSPVEKKFFKENWQDWDSSSD